MCSVAAVQIFPDKSLGEAGKRHSALFIAFPVAHGDNVLFEVQIPDAQVDEFRNTHAAREDEDNNGSVPNARRAHGIGRDFARQNLLDFLFGEQVVFDGFLFRKVAFANGLFRKNLVLDRPLEKAVQKGEVVAQGIVPKPPRRLDLVPPTDDEEGRDFCFFPAVSLDVLREVAEDVYSS